MRTLRTLILVELAGVQAEARRAVNGPYPSYLLGRQKALELVLDAIDRRWPPDGR